MQRDRGTAVLLTIRDASKATGLSVKAIRRRVERRTLPHELVDGVRHVPLAALVEAGLLVTSPEDRKPRRDDPLAALARRIEQLEARVAELEDPEHQRTPTFVRETHSAERV